MTTESLAKLRLLQLTSPSLPVGAYAWSQGLEWAVHADWVNDETSVSDWLRGLLGDGLEHLELPLLARLHRACVSDDRRAFRLWARHLLASRESGELRLEERTRAGAMAKLLVDLNVAQAREWRDELLICHTGAFAAAAAGWAIDLEDTLLGYAYGWLENQVAAAIKLVPLGQTSGQRVLLDLSASIPGTVRRALVLRDDELGASAPAQSMASCLHETQYSRLFRS